MGNPMGILGRIMDGNGNVARDGVKEVRSG